MIPDANEPRLLVSNELEDRIKHMLDKNEHVDIPRNVQLMFKEKSFVGALEQVKKRKRKLVIEISLEDQDSTELIRFIMNDELPTVTVLNQGFKPSEIKGIKILSLTSPVGPWMTISIVKE